MVDGTPIYDNPAFFANYLDLPRQQQGHDGAPEWPILQAMVGTVAKERVLDLGCGLGWFARWAMDNGAYHVDALDVSTKMIEKAREMTPKHLQSTTKGIHYQVKDISEGVALEGDSYDLVYSSLAFHYLSTEAFQQLLVLVSSALKHGGRIVFSVEHPIYTAPSHDDFISVHLPGRSEADLVWPLNRYGYEGLRETKWLGGEVKKYHRTVATHVRSLLEAGFVVGGLREYMATEADLEEHPQWKGALERPMFLLIKAEKSAR